VKVSSRMGAEIGSEDGTRFVFKYTSIVGICCGRLGWFKIGFSVGANDGVRVWLRYSKDASAVPSIYFEVGAIMGFGDGLRIIPSRY